MLAMRSEEKYHEARRRRWFGIDRLKRKPSILGEPEWNVTETGYRYQMNDIAAALGTEHLSELPTLLERRSAIGRWYRRELAGVPGIMLFEDRDDRVSANWLFTAHVERREDFAQMMQSKGVSVSVVHLRIDTNDVFGGLRDDLPTLAKFTDTHMSIPMHDALTDDQVAYVVRCIQEGW